MFKQKERHPVHGVYLKLVLWNMWLYILCELIYSCVEKESLFESVSNWHCIYYVIKIFIWMNIMHDCLAFVPPMNAICQCLFFQLRLFFVLLLCKLCTFFHSFFLCFFCLLVCLSSVVVFSWFIHSHFSLFPSSLLFLKMLLRCHQYQFALSWNLYVYNIEEYERAHNCQHALLPNVA